MGSHFIYLYLYSVVRPDLAVRFEVSQNEYTGRWRSVLQEVGAKRNFRVRHTHSYDLHPMMDLGICICW